MGKYSDTIRALKEEEAAKARQASLAAPAVAPADMGRAQSIAARRGVPAAVVADDLGSWDEREHLDAVEQAAKDAPAFARWMQAPEHAALARGDVPALSRVTGVVGRVSAPSEDTSRSWAEFGSDLALRFKGAAREGVVGLAETPVNLINTVNSWLNASARDLAGLFGQTPDRSIPMRSQPQWLQSLRASTEAINQAEADRGASFKLTAQDAARPDSFFGTLGFAFRNPSSLLTDLSASMGAMSSAVVPGSKAGTIGAQALQQASMAADSVRKQLLQGGHSAETAEAGASEAFGLATLVGLIAPNATPGGSAFEAMLAREGGQLSGSLVRRAGTAVAGEAVSEGLEEGGVQVAQNVATGDPLGKGVGAASASGVALGLGMGGVVTGAEVHGHVREGRSAARDRTVLGALRGVAGAYGGAKTVQEIVEAVGESATAKHSPQAIAALAAEAAPGAQVYLSAEQARVLFQSERVSADAFVGDLLGDEGALREAEAAGGDLVIPMDAFVSKVATLANAGEVARHIRLQADHLSRAELESDALDEQLAEWFGDTAEAADRADPEAGKAGGADQVSQDVLGMLLASGRYRPADAELQAQVVGRVFGRIAARSGQDAFDLYSRYRLRINDAGGRQGKPNTLDPRTDALLTDIRAGAIPDGAEVHGASLLRFLVDRGGLRDSGGELVGRDAVRQRPGLVNNATGVDLDMAREAAVEAGYLPEGADINALLEAVDDELRGRPVYSEQNTDQHALARRTAALDLQRAMDENAQIGAMSDAEFQALSNQELHDLLFPPERSLLQRAGDAVRRLFQRPAEPEADIGSRLLARWEADPEGVAAEYAAIKGTDGGRVIDTDLVRELSPEYRADRRLSPQVHAAASALTKKLFARAVARPVDAGREPKVLFMAGGGGSGKSRARQLVLGEDRSDVIYDGTLSNLGRARTDVAATLASGRAVEIVYVYRSPAKSVDGAIGRAIKTGRPVPLEVLAEAHAKAPEVAKALAQEYHGHDRVSIRVLWNDGALSEAHEIPVEEIPHVDQAEAEAVFRQALDAARQEGRVDEALFRAFAGDEQLRQDAQGDASSRSGQPAGNPVTPDPAAGGVSRFRQPADGGGGHAPRGQLRIGADRAMAIDLFRHADLSTFLHESAHFFLEVMQDVAETSPEVAADLDAIRAWTGNAGGAFTEDQHEQFARGWEAYLREGKAPAPELVSMFGRFRAWLLDLYRDLRQLRVTLTDEVRGVFDRMLATDEEIEAAQVRQGMRPLELVDEARSLLSPGQWEAYVAATAAATEEARHEVLGKLLAAHKREAEAWWQEQLAGIRAEVEAEFEAAPATRAWRVLAGRGEQPEHLRGMRLDRQALVDVYGQQWVKDKLLRLGVYRKAGGVHPDTAAAALGFSSGDALVHALAEVRDLQARIEEHALARMRERHPEPMTDGSLPELAMDAVHGDRRVAALEAEQGILAKLAAQPAPPARLVREYARRKVAGLTLRGIRPNDYLVAERKAARATAKAAAAGDYAQALQHKRAQSLNAALYSEARRGQERAEQQIRALRKLAGDKARERIGKAGKSYLDALDQLLEGHELRPVSGKEVQRRKALSEWVKAQQEADNHTAISEDLLDRVESERVTNVMDLTVQQLDELHEGARNIAHLARMKNELKTKRGRIEWQEAKAEVVARLQQVEASNRTGITARDRGLLERAADGGAAAWNWVLQPETIIEWCDGGETGPLHDLLWQPSEEAEARRNALQRKVGTALKAAFDGISKAGRADLNRRREIRSLDTSLSGHTILSALLNMGNAGNREKLLRGGRVVEDEILAFTQEQLAEMFSTLSAEQARLVQGVWDAVDLLWPEIVAMEEELSGFAPAKIEAQPFTVVTRDGPVQLAGGYYPAVYDPRGSKAGKKDADEQAKRVLSGQTPIKASTSKGHLEKRTDHVAPLLLDYHSVLSQHLAGVMGDISYRQFLKQAYRVLEDNDIRRMIDNRVGPNATKALRAGFERGAVGTYSLAGPLFGPLQGLADAGMTNIAAMALGFRVPLAVANIVTAPILAAARVKKRNLMRGFTSYYLDMPGNVEMIHRLSPMMAQRAQARSIELQAIIDSMAGKAGFRKRMIELSMAVHQWIVPLAENAIWLSRYQEAQDAGSPIDESVALADKAIRQTQTKHQAKDLSQAEGNPYLRPLMMFAGPMVIINNRLQESGLRGLRGHVQTPAQALGAWIAMAAGGSFVFELLMGRGPDDEDDDGLDAGDWAQWCAVKLGILPFGAFPILREVGSYVEQGYSRPHPLVDAAKSIWEFGRSAYRRGDEVFGEGEHPVSDDKLTRDGIRAAGALTGLPSNQAIRTGTYLMEVLAGEHQVENPAKEAVYILQGPPENE